MYIKTKKFFLYLLTLAIFLNAFIINNLSVYAKDTETTENSQIQENFKYIVPMDNRDVSIDYDAGLIIAMQYDFYLHFNEGIREEKYGVFDFDGNIIIKYDTYDYIRILENTGYIEAAKGEDIFYFDKSGKKIDLQDEVKNPKIHNILYNYSDICYALESDNYFSIINWDSNKEVKISKKNLLSSKDDSFIEISQITDDFIVFSTKISTVVFSKNGKLRYRFEKMKYHSSQEVETSFNNPYMPLIFNDKGYAGYQSENRLCGVIDTYGNIIIKPEYRYIMVSNGGDIYAQKNGKWGIIDIDKNIILDFKYDSAYRLKDDIFAVSSDNYETTQLINLKNPDMFKNIEYDSLGGFIDYDAQLMVITKDEKYGVISFDGEIIAPVQYDYIGDKIEDGMIRVGLRKNEADYYSMRYGFIDTKGNVIIPVIYREVAGFSEGLCGVIYREYDKDGNITEEYSAFINKKNKKIISLEKDVWVYGGSIFSEGLTSVRRGDSMFGQCEYIDKTGKTVIINGDSWWGNWVGSFKNGLAIVSNRISGGTPTSNMAATCGVIKYLGDIIRVSIEDTTENWRYVVPLCEYDHCEILSNGLIKIGTTIGWHDWSDGNMPPDPVNIYGLLDRKGNALSDIIYAYISEPNADGYILAEIRGDDDRIKYVLFDDKGKIVFTPKDAAVKLFSRAYSVETAVAYTFYVNNQSYKVLKSNIKKADAVLNNKEEYMNHKIVGIYSKCFVMTLDYGVDISTLVFNYDGTLRYKTERILGNTPDGLVLWHNNATASFVNFDGKELIPAAYGRTTIYPLYDSVKGEAVPGIYVINGYNADFSVCYSIRDINKGEFEAFRWAVYDRIWDCDIQNKLIYLEKGGKIGLYTFFGKQVLPFEYDEIGRIGDGLIRFRKGDISGFANVQGKIVFETDYWLEDFSEGFAKYTTRDWNKGFLNSDFEPVIELDKDWYIMSGFKNGFAVVSHMGEEIMFIDREGNILITQEPAKEAWKYSPTNGFTQDGIAAVSSHVPYARQHGGPIMYDSDGIIEYIGDITSD